MSRFFNDHPRLSVGIAAGTVAVAGAALYYRQATRERPPKTWKQVGEVSEIAIYPIKSCGRISVPAIECTELGPRVGALRDRVFMLTNTEGRFLTGRIHPKMVQIGSRAGPNDTFVLSAPGMADLVVQTRDLGRRKGFMSTLWWDSLRVVDCGNEAAEWLSRFLLNEPEGIRLAFYPAEHSGRTLSLTHKTKFPAMVQKHMGALHDETSYMLMNEASVRDLNGRLKTPVSPFQFRPNILVKGPKAYAEDEWKWVRIGNGAVFKYLRPCLRCVFTTVDPETAVKHPDGEPLNTLKTYRVVEGLGQSPVLGTHFGIVEHGTIKVGDVVYVGVEEGDE